MDSMIFPILIALMVAMLLFGVWQIVAGLLSPEKRKLQARLAAENQHAPGPSTGPGGRASITHQTELTAASQMLMKVGVFRSIHRRLIQAYPDASLAKFVTIMGLAFLFTFMMVTAVTAS